MVKTTNEMIQGNSGKISVRTRGLEEYADKNVLVMVQGANISGQLGFDLSFPEGKNYSFMDAMVSNQIAAVTFSIRGYGQSELNENPLNVQTDQAIEELVSVIKWLNHKKITKIHLLGWSWGGRIVARYAQNNSEKINSLILLDPAMGGGQLILPAPKNEWWDNTYEYFYNRLESEFTELSAREALAKLASEKESKSPNGIRQENAEGSIPINPNEIKNSTLMIYGSTAGAADYMKGSTPRAEFFERLTVDNKLLSVISGGGDYAQLQKPREKIHQIVANFIKQS